MVPSLVVMVMIMVMIMVMMGAQEEDEGSHHGARPNGRDFEGNEGRGV